VALTIPTDALPPETPLTLHLSDAFDVPLTVGVNCCEPPRRTFTDDGAIETVTPEEGFEVFPLGGVVAQPATEHASATMMSMPGRRMVSHREKEFAQERRTGFRRSMQAGSSLGNWPKVQDEAMDEISLYRATVPSGLRAAGSGPFARRHRIVTELWCL
jgi:hypothetical protein